MESDLLTRVESLLSQMRPAERAALLQKTVRELGQAFPGVEHSPDVCGGDACIVRTRIPIWLLEEGRKSGASEIDLLRAYPTLRAEDLANAWAYVRAHRGEIDKNMAENDAVMSPGGAA